MRTVRRWRSTGSQGCPHIRAFGSWTIREQFANHSARLTIWGFSFHVCGRFSPSSSHYSQFAGVGFVHLHPACLSTDHSVDPCQLCTQVLVHVLAHLHPRSARFPYSQTIFLLSVLLPFHSLTDTIRVYSRQFLICDSISQSPLVIRSLNVYFAGRDIVPVCLHPFNGCVPISKFTDCVSVFRASDSVCKILAEVLGTLWFAYVGPFTQHSRICALWFINVIIFSRYRHFLYWYFSVVSVNKVNTLFRIQSASSSDPTPDQSDPLLVWRSSMPDPISLILPSVLFSLYMKCHSTMSICSVNKCSCRHPRGSIGVFGGSINVCSGSIGG